MSDEWIQLSEYERNEFQGMTYIGEVIIRKSWVMQLSVRDGYCLAKVGTSRIEYGICFPESELREVEQKLGIA